MQLKRVTSHRQSVNRSGIARLLAYLALVVSSAAQAHSVCVDSAAALQSALATAAVTSDEGTFINIVKGTYKTTDLAAVDRFSYNSSISDPSFYIVVRGGWNAGCTARTAAAADTVLDGDHATQVLAIRVPMGFVQVYGLTIQNGETDQPGAGMAINDGTNENADVTVSTNIIRNNHTTGIVGGFRAFAGGAGNHVVVRNNVIYGNSADLGVGAASIVDNGAGAVINNNTVTQNTTATAGTPGGLSCFGGCTIANNIARDNTNIDIYIFNSGALLEYNNYGTLGGVAATTTIGNVQVDSGFVDAAAGDFHLNGNSPLLAASPLIYPLYYPYTDPDGHESPSSGMMDIGAYQETVFSNGFDR